MKTFTELEQAKAEGKACENCAWCGLWHEVTFCLHPDTFNSAVPENFCCRQHTDKLPENLESNDTTQNRMV